MLRSDPDYSQVGFSRSCDFGCSVCGFESGDGSSESLDNSPVNYSALSPEVISYAPGGFGFSAIRCRSSSPASSITPSSSSFNFSIFLL